MADLYKYGTAASLYKPIIKRGVVDFAVGADWTPVAGDVKISKDGGAAANVTNLPTALTMGNTVLWVFSLTSTEMQAAKIRITVSDATTKVIEDTAFEIDTYGNTSAEHAADLDNATSLGLSNLDTTVGSRSSQTSIDTIDDFLDTEITDIRNRLPDALVSGFMKAQVKGMDSNVLTAAVIAPGAIDADALATDMDGYTAKLWMFDDNGGTADRWKVIWYKNGVPIEAGVTSPTLRVFKDDGTDLIAATAMTEVGTEHVFIKVEVTNRIVAGVSYTAVAQATIGGATRKWKQPVGRDST